MEPDTNLDALMIWAEDSTYPYFAPKYGSTNKGICDKLTMADDGFVPIVNIKATWFASL